MPISSRVEYTMTINDAKMELSGSTLLITGGTGSFGKAVLRRYLKSDIQKIRILSRDEEKQDLLRRQINDERVQFYIGDVRNRASLDLAMSGVDYVFHAAALKQVPSCEFFPMEAVNTNVIGASNVLESSTRHGVRKAVFLSTDKAVYPVNAMGMSKALMEKLVVAKARAHVAVNTMCCLTRYGNVMGSRGSVLPLFIEQILNGDPLTITNPTMTRFLMSLEDAIDLVEFAFERALTGDIIVQKAPAATIETLAKALSEIFNVPYRANIIGVRHGEKHYETLVSKEEMYVAEDFKKHYRIPADRRDLNYNKYTNSGNLNLDAVTEFTSANKDIRLDVTKTKALLMKQDFMLEVLNGR